MTMYSILYRRLKRTVIPDSQCNLNQKFFFSFPEFLSTDLKETVLEKEKRQKLEPELKYNVIKCIIIDENFEESNLSKERIITV